MLYVEAFSEEYVKELPSNSGRSLFLAGGISNCYPWQGDLVKLLTHTDLAIINPRRKNYVDSIEVATSQIEWEHRHLNAAEAISFWFASETICPITLFEYGKFLTKDKVLFVGCHPNYKRKLDLEVQTRLERPYIDIVSSIESLAKQILIWDSEEKKLRL